MALELGCLMHKFVWKNLVPLQDGMGAKGEVSLKLPRGL
jgi:hypothetical protein